MSRKTTLFKKFVHKPTTVLAVQVTKRNYKQIAEAVGGYSGVEKADDSYGAPCQDFVYVEVPYVRFVVIEGEWLVKEDHSYSNGGRDFNKLYDPAE